MADHADDLRTAWRATLGTAAMLADAAAKQCETSNSSRGRVTQVGQFGAGLLKSLGDELWALRERDPAEMDSTMRLLLVKVTHSAAEPASPTQEPTI